MRLFVETPQPKFPSSDRALRVVLVAAALVALVLPTGCVRRRLNVRSNPPGALVFVDNQQIGTTPCSVDFTYYGTREIRLVKPGFETLTVNQPIPMPWYQIPPIDFVSENVVPNRITDHRTVSFDMQPQVIVPTEQLLDRANQLRQETQQTAVTPPAIVTPPGVVASPGVVTAPSGAAVPPGMFAEPGPVSPPGGFAPLPATSPQGAYPPAATPTPLPPVDGSQPFGSQPPPTFAPTTPAPYSATPSPYGTTPAPSGTAPVPYGTPSPYGATPGTTPSPFAAPTLPSEAAPIGAPAPQILPPAGSPQQGPPIVSPPLR